MAPTPGTDINSRARVSQRAPGAHLILEAVKLAPQRDTYRQQALRDRLRARMPGNEFANPSFEACWRGWPDFEAKAAQNATSRL